MIRWLMAMRCRCTCRCFLPSCSYLRVSRTSIIVVCLADACWRFAGNLRRLVRPPVCMHFTAKNQQGPLKPMPFSIETASPPPRLSLQSTSHINRVIHMQRMFSLTYSEKPLRLQRMAGAPNILRIQNLPFGDKVYEYPPHSSMKALYSSERAVSSFRCQDFLHHSTKQYEAIVLTTEACSDCSQTLARCRGR